MRVKKLFAGMIAFLMVLATSSQLAFASNVLTGTQKAYVEGDDWGAAVTGTVIHFNKRIDWRSVAKKDFSVVENSQDVTDKSRKVIAAYTSDSYGRKVHYNSYYVTVRLYSSPRDGSAFHWNATAFRNEWVKNYSLKVQLTSGNTLTSNGRRYSLLNVTPSIDMMTDRIIPQLDYWDLDLTYKTSDGTQYRYAQYVPKRDNKKNALVIWLHGGGEGGTDTTIPLLANKVTAYSSKKFQSYFKGAYILVPQTPTFWMESVNGGSTTGQTAAKFEKSLFEFIKKYVKNHKDIDPNRVIIGGCSNGGYMTMNLIMKHPKYFAAAYPICEGYADKYITNKQLKKIVNMPIWFTYAKTDTTLDPKIYSEPTIKRLKKMGAGNIHVSAYKDVHDTTGRFYGVEGNPTVLSDTKTSVPYEYSGHWSWIYYDNNKNHEGWLNCWKWMSRQRAHH